jgi:hypothetical protein
VVGDKYALETVMSLTSVFVILYFSVLSDKKVLAVAISVWALSETEAKTSKKANANLHNKPMAVSLEKCCIKFDDI